MKSDDYYSHKETIYCAIVSFCEIQKVIHRLCPLALGNVSRDAQLSVTTRLTNVMQLPSANYSAEVVLLQ